METGLQDIDTNHRITMKRPSSLLNYVDYDLIDWVEKEEVLFFYHDFGISVKNFETNEILNRNYYITSTYLMKDKGEPYVGSIQGKEFPFFGIQYHTEYSIYDHGFYKAQHDPNTIDYALALSRFFVNQCRRNNNKFDNEEQKKKHVISNYDS